MSQSLPLPFTRKRHSQVNVVLFVLICKVGLCVTCVFGEFAFLIKFCLRDGGSRRVVILLINVAFAYLSLENVRTCSNVERALIKFFFSVGLCRILAILHNV